MIKSFKVFANQALLASPPYKVIQALDSTSEASRFHICQNLGLKKDSTLLKLSWFYHRIYKKGKCFLESLTLSEELIFQNVTYLQSVSAKSIGSLW